MTGDQQDQISFNAQLSEKIIQFYEDIAGEIDLSRQIYNNSTGSTLVIDGITITQQDLDSVQSFHDAQLTTTQVVDSAFAISALKDYLLGIMPQLRGTARLE